MNRSILSNVLMFAAGAAVGSVVTWKLVKTKYEQITIEEINAIREMYAGDERNIEEDEDSEESDEPDDMEEYEELVENAGYVRYNQNEEEEDDEVIEPYVIIPEEFDENGYETESLVYYADGVLAYNDTNEVIENPDDLVCSDFETHFGEYEADSVYVRNDNLKMDFEILKDERTYAEVD